MIEWFKDGKTLPRRYVWEIVLGAYNQFIQEESLVELVLEDGVTCDVIGDVHGMREELLTKGQFKIGILISSFEKFS